MHLDWSTLVLQTVNVLILLWLLRRFLFRPVVAIVAERKNAAEKQLADAEIARAQAQAQVEQTARQQQALTADSERILADARTAAETERAALLERRRPTLHRCSMPPGKPGAAAWANPPGTGSGSPSPGGRHRVAVAGPDPAACGERRAGGVARLVRAAPNGVLAEPGETLEVVTATPLDPATRRHARTCAATSWAIPPPRFVTDPSLIAGVELRGPHARWHNNWRADLDRIAEELGLDDKHLGMA